MNTESQREGLRWKLKPFPELVRLAWPIAVSMLSYSVMTLVDTVFAGRLGATSLGAVGFGGIVTFTILCFGMGLLRAAKVVVAQAVGAARPSRIPGAVGTALVLAVTVGIATAMLGEVVALGLPHVAEGSAAVRTARDYVAIRLIGAPLVLVAFAVREIRTAIGDARAPMRAALIANAGHVPMNAALMFGAGLGVQGAAISTVVAQGIEAALLIRVQQQDGLGLRTWTRRDLTEFWGLGWPLGLERLFNVGAFTVLVALVARVSDTDLAAHQVAHQVNLFALLPLIAIGEAAAVLAGQAVGAGEDHLVKKVARIATAAGTAYGALSAMVYLIFGSLITEALTPDHAVAHLAVKLLWVGALWQAFNAAYFVSGAVLRGAGDVRFATIAMVTTAWVVTPPLVLLFGFTFGLGAFGGWLALLLEVAIGAAILVGRVESGGWKRAARESRERLESAPDRALVPKLASG